MKIRTNFIVESFPFLFAFAVAIFCVFGASNVLLRIAGGIAGFMLFGFAACRCEDDIFAEALVKEIRMVEGESQVISVPRVDLSRAEMLHIIIKKADMRLSLKELFQERDDFKVIVYVNGVSRKEFTFSFVQDKTGDGAMYGGEVEHKVTFKKLGLNPQDDVAIQIENPYHKVKVKVFTGVRIATYFSNPIPRQSF